MSDDSDSWDDDSESFEDEVEETVAEKKETWSDSEEDQVQEQYNSESEDGEKNHEEEEEDVEDLNIWEPPNTENWEKEEPVKYASHYYEPDLYLGDDTRKWKIIQEDLEEFLEDDGPSLQTRFRNVWGTMYKLSKPIWETVGEDRHVHFLVDLDSLLCDLAESPQLDFEHGLQVLPCVHLLERRIVQLRAGGRRPMLIAFDCMKVIWEERPDILLLRQIMILHLQSLGKVALFQFSDFWCREWLDFASEWLPAFVVVSAPGCKSIRKDCHYLFEAFIVYIQYCQSLPIVFSSCLSIKSNALQGHKISIPHQAKRFCRKYFGSFHDGMQPVHLPKAQVTLPEFKEDLWKAAESAAASVEDQIIVYTCACLLQENKDKSYCALLCLSRILQNYLPLESRRFVLPEHGQERLMEFLGKAYPHCFTALDAVFSKVATAINAVFLNPSITEQQHKPITFLTDIIDGRLMHYVASEKRLLNYAKDLGLPAENEKQLESLWKAVCDVSGTDMALFPILERDEQRVARADHQDKITAIPAEVMKKSCIALQTEFTSGAFSNFQNDLDAEKLIVDAPEMPRGWFWEEKENNDWQYGKKVNDIVQKHPQPVTIQEKRNAQNYLAFIEKYSRSLQPGKIVLRDVIVAQKEGKKKQSHPKKSDAKGKKKKGKKHAGKNDIRERARLEIEAKARAAKNEKTKNFIGVLRQQHPNSAEGLEKRIHRLDLAFQSEADPESALPGLMQLREWCEEAARRSRQNTEIRVPIVRLWQVSHDIFRRFSTAITVPQCRLLQRSMLIMGYDKAAHAMAEEYCQINKEQTMAHVLVDPESVEAEIAAPPSYERFQLEFGGHLMVRSVDSAYDPRVSGFYPDKWQRELLDVVDAKGSALVVAPTSSGKTFVSWYAMKNTLINNKSCKLAKNKRRIVYVCPTKALVQQAAAEVYAKYGDVFGIFTQDYDHKILESEVTVVVPETFEILLTSPQREAYIKSIDYVIFDEVHCLDEGNGGEVWERLFMLVRCPFIALSATVGEPHVFQAWLTRIGRPFALSQAKRGSKYHDQVQLIYHHLRWSDLQKYIYCPIQSTMDENGVSLYETGKLHIQKFRGDHTWKSSCIDIHPAAAVAMSNGLDHFTDGFPLNLSFSPKDSLRLYDCMVREADRTGKNLLETLRNVTPAKFFDDLVITKRQARVWELELKRIVWSWVEMGEEYAQSAKKVLDDLASKPRARIKQMEEAHFARNEDPYSFEFVLDNITNLLIDLEQQSRLPVLVFCLDRAQCEQLLERVVSDLEKAAKGFNNSISMSVDDSREEKRREKEIKKIQKSILSLEKSGSKSDKSGSGTVRNDAKEQIEALQEKLLNLRGVEAEGSNRVDERFSFMKNGETLEEDDMEYWKRRTVRKSAQLQSGNHILMRCLQRGIGIHHGSLSIQYKHFVETLFRAKHLKVVITVETLAMGVNMPARSVVFAGDHPDLNPLAYRQMMGRAGRRGYDNIGHVTFLGIQPRKVAYLMTSQLTSLTGHYPITPGMCLKIAQQNENFSSKKECSTVLTNLMTPRFDRRLVGKLDGTSQLRRNTFFTYEYLYHFGMIDEKGRCRGLAGVATHLFRYEPANLIFVRLLESGIFHELTRKYDPKNKISQQQFAAKILHVLCHVFHDRICIPPEVRPKSSSVLKPLPKKISSLLTQYDSETMSLYEHFTRTMGNVSECKDFQASRERLPLSEVDFAKPASADTTEGTLLDTMRPPQAQCVSLFSAMSDPYDTFDSERLILERGRDDFVFNSKSITSSEVYDMRGRKLQKNSFALNFYNTENYSQVISENYLRDGLAWEYLKRWQLLLKDLRHALRAISALEEKLKGKAMARRKVASQQEEATYIEVSHRHSVYKGARLLKDAYTGEVIKVLRRGHTGHEYEDVKETEDMVDPLVQAFSFLAMDFEAKFKNVGHLTTAE